MASYPRFTKDWRWEKGHLQGVFPMKEGDDEMRVVRGLSGLLGLTGCRWISVPAIILEQLESVARPPNPSSTARPVMDRDEILWSRCRVSLKPEIDGDDGS
jgi:hypothetical protein